MLKLLLLAVLLLAVAGGAAYWTLARDDDPAEAGVQVVRWFDASVAIPEGSGLAAVQRYWQDDRPVLIIGPSHDIGLGVAIDAVTGEFVADHRDRASLSERALMDQALRSVSVSALDRSTAPWPYNGKPPGTVPEAWGMTSWGKVTFIPPDPASGIRVVFQEGDGTDGPSKDLGFTNGQSTLAIKADTGTVYAETTTIRPGDQEAFDRLLSTVRLVEP